MPPHRSSPSSSSAAPDEQATSLADGLPAQSGPELVSGAVLVLHEGISTPAGLGCPRWPETVRLRNLATGELIRGRCRATNLCDYCAKLAAVETSQALALDAVDHFGPEVWACLTTRSAITSPAPFYRAREKVRRALRRRWPECEDATLVEFTTGYGSRSGGLRRPHWNLLLKGIPAAEVDAVREIVPRVWCNHVDALPGLQHVGPVREAGGLMRYLALHFMKESQAPPKGWKGHRFTSSRGYFPEGAPAARKRARDVLRLERELWRLDRMCKEAGVDLGAEERLTLAEQLRSEKEAVRWDLARVQLMGRDTDKLRREAARRPFRLPGIESRSG